MKLPALAAFLLGICISSALCQPPDDHLYRGPVQAEFLKRLNVRQLTPGETVFAQVTLGWEGPDCSLRPGAILEAKVVQAEPRKTHGQSSLALSFVRAQCNGSPMIPFDLVLAALADPPVDWKVVPNTQFRMPVSFSNPHPGGQLAGIGSAAAGDTYSTQLDLAGIIHRFPMTPKVQPGDVIGLKGLKLTIGTGPDRSSVLSAKDRDISLVAFTQVLLVPASLAFDSGKLKLGKTGAPSAPSPASLKSRAPGPAPINNLEICAPPGCAVDLPVTPSELEGHSAAAIAIQPLGYAPRSHKALGDFDDEAALAWLGPSRLLFTFNPHPLIHRDAVDSGTSRVIRAVLLDAQNRSVLRSLEWQITDAQRYLWPLGGNRILVHVGNQLRVYGASLDVEQSFPLTGPLASVRIAPGGALIAVATLRERHTPELHAQLRQDLSAEPEEDLDVTVLDKDFNPIASTSAISGLLPPTLLNEGQVKLLAGSAKAYRLAMSTWQNTESTLARFESMCTPQLSSIAPDLLFLLSCDAQTGDTQYRVVSPDGKLVLRGSAGPREVGFDAAGSTQAFAMKFVHASRDLSFGADFTGDDLDSAELRVYRATDGKRLFSIRVKDPSTSMRSYALSPAGSRLAVLAGSEIKLFTVPAE
ncbi:MAG TPA: hypothetical protein VGL22_13855 [Terracidiphilus sp.]